MEMAVRLKAFSPLGLGPGPSCAPLGSETCGPWFSDPRRCLAMESLPLTPLPPCISFAGLKEGDLWGADREAEGEEVGARGRAKATPQGSPHPAQPIQSRPHWNLVLYSPLHSPTQTSHPALPTPSTPASRQQDQSHQGCSHCSLTSWKNRTSKCRNRQNQRTVGLAPPGSCGSLGSGPRQVQHQLHPFPGGIHVKGPTELLLKPAPFLLENIPLWVFSRHAEARKVNPSVFRIDLMDFASTAGWLRYLLIYTSLRPGLQG